LFLLWDNFKILKFSKINLRLKLKKFLPNGQNLTEISTNENGIVKKQRRRSEMAKLMMNRLRDVRILGFRATTTQTSPLPIVPININIVYAITNAIRLILSRALLLIYRSNFSIIFEISASEQFSKKLIKTFSF
jgi:hypothetical protein